jgi:hypothetical protein
MNTVRVSKELSIAKSAMLVEEERTLFLFLPKYLI